MTLAQTAPPAILFSWSDFKCSPMATPQMYFSNTNQKNTSMLFEDAHARASPTKRFTNHSALRETVFPRNDPDDFLGLTLRFWARLGELKGLGGFYDKRETRYSIRLWKNFSRDRSTHRYHGRGDLHHARWPQPRTQPKETNSPRGIDSRTHVIESRSNNCRNKTSITGT